MVNVNVQSPASFIGRWAENQLRLSSIGDAAIGPTEMPVPSVCSADIVKLASGAGNPLSFKDK